MRAVLDTNVLVRALMSPRGTWGDVLARAEEYRHVTSTELIFEFLRVVADPRVGRRLGPEGRRTHTQRVLALMGRAEIVSLKRPPRVSRDRGDDKPFACAVAGDADCIVSEDEDVLAVPQFGRVRTVRAAEFLRLLDAAR